MQGLWLLFVLVAGFSSNQLVHSADWDYETNGPDTWPITYSTCSGSSQSPVDLNVAEVVTSTLPELVFNGHWSSDAQATFANNGHSAEITVKSWTTPATLSGGPLSGNYIFSNIHFHWGSDSSVGSEHTLGGKSFPMEAHVVHYNEAYGDVTTASGFPDGIAVVGYFLQQGNSTNTDLSQLTAALALISNYQSSTDVPLLAATQWFHSSATAGGYLTYAGSLTTPPCSEAVTWIVYSEPVSISSVQVALFRTLKSPSGSLLLTNYRPTQNLNNRTVKLSKL